MQPIRGYPTCHSERSEESRIKFGPFNQGKIDRDVSLAQFATGRIRRGEHDSAIWDMGLCFAAPLPTKISESIFYELYNHRSDQVCSDF